MKDDGMLTCLDITEWKTPATQYELAKLNNVSIIRIKQKAGYYNMEGVRGYEYYRNKKRIPVTCLKIGEEVVMIDDPLNWYGMYDLAEHCTGRVLAAGLGLGLVLHGLQSNKNVTKIDVVENNPDVIKLMRENIPPDNRIDIIHRDFWEYLESNDLSEGYNTVLLDIWWGDGNSQMALEMNILRFKVSAFIPEAKIMIWGLRDPEINPAVIYSKPEQRKIENL